MVGAVTSSGSYHPLIVLRGARYGGGEKQAPQSVAGLPAGALRWAGEKGGYFSRMKMLMGVPEKSQCARI